MLMALRTLEQQGKVVRSGDRRHAHIAGVRVRLAVSGGRLIATHIPCMPPVPERSPELRKAAAMDLSLPSGGGAGRHGSDRSLRSEGGGARNHRFLTPGQKEKDVIDDRSGRIPPQLIPRRAIMGSSRVDIAR
jgi:hypothetical protein